MTIHSILMATFPSEVPTGMSGARKYTPFNEVTKFDFLNAVFSRISIQDDDPNFDDARDQYETEKEQSLTEPVRFGNDTATTPAGVRLTNFIHSTIEMVDADGTGTGKIFNLIFPTDSTLRILGGKHSVLIIPAQTRGEQVPPPAGFEPTATYRFKEHVPHSINSPPIPYPAPNCFTAGTLIETQSGPRPVETLHPGDYVATRDNGMRRLSWIGGRELSQLDLDVNPAFRPIRILAGALGKGLPVSDLTVSPQHRILVRCHISQRLFGRNEVLVAAKHLTGIPGISVVRDARPVAYWHLLFDAHELVLSNGAWTESFYTGPQAVKSLSPAARREITMLFPALTNADLAPAWPKARPFLTGSEGRKLARHCLRTNTAPIDA